MSPSASPPEFFIDRSLGRKHLATALRGAGVRVLTMADVYGESAAQALADETWLADAGRSGWIVLMKDSAIRRRPAELASLTEHRVRAFCLTNANLRGAAQSARFIENLPAIRRHAERPGPYIFGVYERSVRQLWPRVR